MLSDSMPSKRFSLVVLTAILTTACGGYSSSPSPGPSPTLSPSTGGAPLSVTIPVGAQSLGNRAFSPDELNVAVGTAVTWTNGDAVSHTSTSDATGWNSGTIPPGGRFSFTFQSAGTFPYHCTIHPGMVGTVNVR
jgi:plastocyanin